MFKVLALRVNKPTVALASSVCRMAVRASISTKAAAPASVRATVLCTKPLRAVRIVRHMSGGADSNSKGPGAILGTIPRSIEQGSGIEHEELTELEHHGHTRFDRQELHGPFGTVTAPVQVPSGHDTRIVACTGGGENEPEHAPLYFNVTKGPLTACPVCAQVFTLVEPSPIKADASAHAH